MGLSNAHALGRNRKFHCKLETTALTQIKPAATDAAKILKFMPAPVQARKDRIDSRQSRSVLERITMRKDYKWSLEAYLIPSGSAGTAPDLGPLLKGVLGSETVVGGTSVTYGLANSQTLDTFSLYSEHSKVLMEAMWGAVAESVTLRLSGGEEPKVIFEGFAASYAHTGTSTLNGAPSGNDVTVETADQDNFYVGSLVEFLDPADDSVRNNNSNAGFLITAKNGAVLTLDGTPTGVLDNDKIVPYGQSETVAGSPLGGINGSVQIDSTATPITGAEITFKNNHKVINDEVANDSITDYIPGTREVSGRLSIRARKDLIINMGKRNTFPARDLALQVGTTAGSICTINVDQPEFDTRAIDYPEEEEAIIPLPFKGIGSSGEDEGDVAFT